MPPPNIHWNGLPRYCLPRIRRVSQQSIIHDSPLLAAQNVCRSPLGEAFERTRQQQQMRARRHRIARSQATFPNLAIYRRSVRGDNRNTTTRRQVIFPRRRPEGRPPSAHSQSRRTSGQSRQVRRVTAQQKLITSRASLRRNISSTRQSQPRRSTSTRSSPRLSTSSRSSDLRREPSTRSTPATKRLPQIQIHRSRSLRSRSLRSRSLRSRSPRPRLASPAPYWGTIPSPISGVRNTPLDKQTFVSRRVDGKYVHEPLRLKQSANDVLHRGLSNSSRKSRIYDKRLPTRKGQAETQNGYIILPDARTELPLLFPSTLDFAKLDGSSIGPSSSSSSRIMYPDEESSSNIVNGASRTTSEARALDDFTQGLQQHLQTTYANPRPRSPSVARTVVSTHTLQDLVAFREEFKAAGLAVTSKDQKSFQRQPQRNSSPKVGAQYSRAAAARRPSIGAASVIAPPRTNHSTLNVPAGVELKSPRSVSPLVQGGNSLLIAVRSSIDQGSNPAEESKIPSPREKPAPKKALPWLKNSELQPGQEPLRAFRPPLPSEAPSRATDRSSVTTIIDFSPHPSEFWDKQGLNFNDFQNRHPGLSMERSGSLDIDHGTIMLENEMNQPIVMVVPQQPHSQVIVHDKSGPPKPVRIELFEKPHGGGGHRAPSPLQSQLFPEDIDVIDADLVRADSLDELRDKNPVLKHGLPTIPDFSSFISSSNSVTDQQRRSSVPRPKSAGDERSDDRPTFGRRASREEIWAEKKRRAKEDFLKQARGQAQYDEQRTKFEIKKITPWELNSESTDTGDMKNKGKLSDDHPQVEIIGTKTTEPAQYSAQEMDGAAQQERKGLFGHGKLSDLKSKMRGLFGADRESRSSTEEEPPQPAPPLPLRQDSYKTREKEKAPEKPTIIVPECEDCPTSYQGPSSSRPSSLNEPKSARSFQEWQAGVPFKPLSRESSINEHNAPEDLLPCGHPRKPKVGDPVKRNVAARRTKPPPSIAGTSRAPSIFTIQETVPKAMPKIAPYSTAQAAKKPTVVHSDSGSISDSEVLKGLGIVMEGVLNEDVQAWIKQTTGTNVRRFLADLSTMDKPGTHPPTRLAEGARRNVSRRRVAMERLGSRKMGRSEGSVL